MDEKKKNKFVSKYYTIPAEVFYDSNLTDTAKFLFPIIESLDNVDGCFASNEYLAEILKVSAPTITRSVSVLIQFGYIEKIGFDGRKRILRLSKEYRRKGRLEAIKDFENRLDKAEEFEYADSLAMNSLPNHERLDIYNRLNIIDKNSSKEELVPDGTPAPGSRLNRLSKGEKIRLKMLLDKDIPAPKPHKTPKPLPVVPQNIQSLIDSWNALGLRQHARPDTKLYKDLMTMLKGLLRGTLFKGLIKEYANRSFSEEEILAVFSSIKQAAIPANGIVSSTAGDYFKHVSLSDVIYNYRTKRSWFLNFFENPKNPLAQSVPLNDDPQPVVTNTFKRFYHKEVLGGASYKISNIEENKFRLGAKKTIDFLNANRNSFIGIAGLQDLASLVCDALRDSVRDQVKDLEPGHFCSDRTFRKILPAYLHSQGLLAQ
uniref:Putative DNA binding, helix-turn-helix domain containing protein n=1 Tax=viral metagenome TaxID=1070528 RepID=A0A6M3IJ48_9ZZZZ